MANRPNRRITPALLKADLDSYAALQAIESYAPSNGKCELGALATLKQKMEARQTAETQAAGAYAAARDAAAETEWEFHDNITLSKTQVEAQFGPDSDQVQSVGRKKKSEYSRPARRGSSDQGSTQ